MNTKRMANRARAAARGAGTPGYGAGHKATSSTGSPHHTEMRGPGPVAGAGEVMTGGPGAAAAGVSPHVNDVAGNSPAASGKPPKGMSVYSEE